MSSAISIFVESATKPNAAFFGRIFAMEYASFPTDVEIVIFCPIETGESARILLNSPESFSWEL